jgi:hypothetical protein
MLSLSGFNFQVEMMMSSTIIDIKSAFPVKTNIEDRKATVLYDKETPVNDKGIKEFSRNFLIQVLLSDFEITVKVKEPNQPRAWVEYNEANNTFAAMVIANPVFKAENSVIREK